MKERAQPVVLAASILALAWAPAAAGQAAGLDFDQGVELAPLLRQAPDWPPAALAGAGRVPAKAGPAPALSGDVPVDLVGMEESVAAAWDLAREIGAAPPGLAPPVIQFSPFDLALQDQAWNDWQAGWLRDNDEPFLDWLCTRWGQEAFPETAALCADRAALAAWLSRHPEARSHFPFPKRFGAYTSGHEMLHYIMEARGVPIPRHHCLFVTPRPATGKAPVAELAEALVRLGHASDLLYRFGPEAEAALDPCGQPQAALCAFEGRHQP